MKPVCRQRTPQELAQREKEAQFRRDLHEMSARHRRPLWIVIDHEAWWCNIQTWLPVTAAVIPFSIQGN